MLGTCTECGVVGSHAKSCVNAAGSTEFRRGHAGDYDQRSPGAREAANATEAYLAYEKATRVVPAGGSKTCPECKLFGSHVYTCSSFVGGGPAAEHARATKVPAEFQRMADATERARASATEVRIVDPKTGGEKGQKLERFDLIPFEALTALARVYGKGAQKYADDNWRKGYSWRLSLGAMLRHIALWAIGVTYDAETGEHHLSHAAWHCFTLFVFETQGLGTDDRATVSK